MPNSNAQSTRYQFFNSRMRKYFDFFEFYAHQLCVRISLIEQMIDSTLGL